MLFTTAGGALANRQAVLKTIERAARSAGIDPAGLGNRSIDTARRAAEPLDSTVEGLPSPRATRPLS